MKLGLFVVYDAKVQVYTRPQLYLNKAEALRQFQEAANDEKSNICKYASDYTLFEIGSYDELKGELVVFDKISLGCAVEYKKG